MIIVHGYDFNECEDQHYYENIIMMNWAIRMWHASSQYKADQTKFLLKEKCVKHC